jgi:hypothetical protein
MEQDLGERKLESRTVNCCFMMPTKRDAISTDVKCFDSPETFSENKFNRMKVDEKDANGHSRNSNGNSLPSLTSKGIFCGFENCFWSLSLTVRRNTPPLPVKAQSRNLKPYL